MLPASSLVNVQASGTTATTIASADLVNAIVQELIGAGLNVTNSNINAPALAGYIVGVMTYQYALTLQVQTRIDYDDASSVAALVRGAIEDQAGQAPDALTYQVASQALQATTGVNPSLLPAAVPSGVSSLFSGLQSDAQLILIALVALVALIAFGPNIRSLAGARG